MWDLILDCVLDALKDGALRQLCGIGRHLIGLFEESRFTRKG